MKKTKVAKGDFETLTGDDLENLLFELSPGFNGFDCDSLVFDLGDFRYYVNAAIINRSQDDGFDLIPALHILRRKLE